MLKNITVNSHNCQCTEAICRNRESAAVSIVYATKRPYRFVEGQLLNSFTMYHPDSKQKATYLNVTVKAVTPFSIILQVTPVLELMPKYESGYARTLTPRDYLKHGWTVNGMLALNVARCVK